MKGFLLLLIAVSCSFLAYGQRNIKTRNLWTTPEVHIQFNDYTLSFTLKDVNKALRILASEGIPYQDAALRLDSGVQYNAQVMPGLRMEYQFPVQALMQNVVGAYLMSIGRVLITNKRGKTIPEFILDIDYAENGVNEHLVSCYDPKNKTLLFQGRMPAVLLHKDIGLDD